MNDELRAAAVEYCNRQHSSGRCVFDYDDVIRAFLAGAVWRPADDGEPVEVEPKITDTDKREVLRP